MVAQHEVAVVGDRHPASLRIRVHVPVVLVAQVAVDAQVLVRMDRLPALIEVVMVDVEGGNNVMYLPLDKLGNMPTLSAPDTDSDASGNAAQIAGAGAASQRLRELDRDRGSDRKREVR